ncbi:MAG: GNAT family N-acetyltransferase [Aliidongia sp.]
MTESFTIEVLSGTHHRTSFACGVPELDRYFREFVSQDVKRRLSNCFVALDGAGDVAGYYTLAATSLPLTELPPEDTKRLPRYPLLPAGLIGRLAVDQRFRGQGLGSALIVNAIDRSMRAEPAIFALVVDAKDETAVSFYRHLGFRRFVSQPMRLFLPIVEAARRGLSL